MKDPGNEDVLEDGTYENIKRDAINCRLQVLGYRLQVKISLMNDRNVTAFFCCDVFMQKKASVDVPCYIYESISAWLIMN